MTGFQFALDLAFDLTQSPCFLEHLTRSSEALFGTVDLHQERSELVWIVTAIHELYVARSNQFRVFCEVFSVLVRVTKWPWWSVAVEDTPGRPAVWAEVANLAPWDQPPSVLDDDLASASVSAVTAWDIPKVRSLCFGHSYSW